MFTLSGPITHLTSAALYRGSATIAVYYWKSNGAKFAMCHKWKDLIPVYHKTDVLGLPTFLRDKFARWAGNSSYVEEIWKNVKEIVFESIKLLFRKKLFKKIGS
jgi:hypothetical protein